MVQLVRLSQGLTQGELAATSKVSQAVLSKAESGIVDLEADRLTAIATALNVPVDRLTSGEPADGLLTACAFHRKRATLPVSDAKRIRAVLDLTNLEVDAILSDRVPEPRVPREAPTDDGWTSPTDIAREIRTALGLGAEPITDLVAVIEQLGAVVLVRDLDATKIDAIGSWPAGYRPLFLLNATSPADRRRFTLAHEFGHAVMHAEPRSEQEREADQFASELLLPANGVRDDLTNLDLGKLALLKRKWGASMAALIRKARDLGAITEHEYRRLNIELSTAGYRTREPVDLLAESPALVAASIQSRLAEGATVEDLARLTHMLPEKFDTTYLREAP
jgi:Zn-dependent peptidase ImmA (M78 family)/transcriptional regulator with XRE-family HTH domain